MNKTVFNQIHISSGAKMVEFGGWEMPVQYKNGIINEHLTTRNNAGLFDVSHMGRLIIKGKDALSFLQHVLSSNCAGLLPDDAQYTMIPDNDGGAVDDAYLYRFFEEEYLLVVNASNIEKDLKHLKKYLSTYPNAEIVNKTYEISMISLQGPESKNILKQVLDRDVLPDPLRNNLLVSKYKSNDIWIARTGYTGEPLGFELFISSELAAELWTNLTDAGASPVGLGARDTLRLEASLPLYGHELGLDPEDKIIPIFACPLAKFAVSFSKLKGDFVGRGPLQNQFEAFKRYLKDDFSELKDLPKIIKPLAVFGKRIARPGSKVYKNNKHIGWITSGTMAPYWIVEGEGLDYNVTQNTALRSICFAYIDSDIDMNEFVEVEIRDKRYEAVTVPYNLRSEAPPFSRAIIYNKDQFIFPEDLPDKTTDIKTKSEKTCAVRKIVKHKEKDIIDNSNKKSSTDRVELLLKKSIENTIWRQKECINLIPSEQTQSPMVRLLSIMDPVFRYGEHKKVKAFEDSDIFYYQGTEFINEVEILLNEEIKKYLGCSEVESRLLSGQMANAVVFSALVSYINREDRKKEQRRIRCVMNNHIIKGGHLSSQPMGALKDFIARDPETEKAAVVNFPVLVDNPYKIDIDKTKELIDLSRPELIILGKSMIIHKEPVKEIRRFIDDLSFDTVLMYDMAHVLGLVGPYFQEPFKEGADLVTGSTHKTFFGTQRGIVTSDYKETDKYYALWEAINRRAFPGSVSNHHLGTMLGLLLSAYEMNYFKDQYQKAVIDNAKIFAKALKETGLDVAGDEAVSFTETHQVLIKVGYNKGVEAAQKLEENNIIVNFQASPSDEGFTASGSLRIGTSEMTRFGMEADGFEKLAGYIHDVVVKDKSIKNEVASFRKEYLDLKYCFSEKQYDDYIQKLHGLV